MALTLGGAGFGSRPWLRIGGVACLAFTISCSTAQRREIDTAGLLRDTSDLVQEVRAFGNALGIQSAESLSRSAGDQAPLSMLWLWLQREGTLALRAPVDIRMAVGFNAGKERIPLERVYRIAGYSVYYRQGNEFADPRAVVTVGFAEEGLVRQVKVIVHEDLHDDKNFALPWEIEESVVTPLGSLIAVEFFRHRRDDQNLRQAMESLEEERRLSRELNALVAEAERLFGSKPLNQAKEKILALIPSYPAYHRQFQRQVADQHAATVLEAKLSHDLAYYRHFDTIASLAEIARDLRTLIQDLKRFPHPEPDDRFKLYLQDLKTKYSAPGV